MVDSVFETRTQGIGAEGIKDQYADGKAAQVWELFIGGNKSRTEHYKNFLVGLLKKKGCKRILDLACGTGVDSIMLLEEGFDVTSIDASDKMLKHALKSRWDRRKEPAFDKWVIEEANWLTVAEDIEDIIGDGFDAVICLGNSFAHMPDLTGDQQEHRIALKNFERCVKPGGLLLIDHRNYDHILDHGATPSKCIYYNSKRMTDIKTSTLYVNGKANLVVLDYSIDTTELQKKKKKSSEKQETVSYFRLSYYPHRLQMFKDMLAETFKGQVANHTIYGDFKLLEEIETPAFFIHVVEKKKK